jgi:hypothetical protein
LGCTTDAISLELARVTGLKVHELSEEVPLQLGMAGGKSWIVFGTMVKMQYASINVEHYLDIININKYDTIIGTIFMRKYRIALDFGNEQITIKGVLAPTMSILEEKDVIMFRQSIHERFKPKKVWLAGKRAVLEEEINKQSLKLPSKTLPNDFPILMKQGDYNKLVKEHQEKKAPDKGRAQQKLNHCL